MAKALLARRQMLKEQLPTVIRTLEAEEQNLAPKAKKALETNKKINAKVSDLKEKRNSAQKKANELLKIVKESKTKLMEADGMVNLDPSWKKEKLFDEIEEIEKKIETSALDHKAERKLLDRRKKIIEINDKWLRERRDSNPEMVTYINARREMNTLFRDADKSHRNMLDGVEKAQPQHDKQVKIRNELKEIRRQLDRAKELLSQSDKAISHWERRLSQGFGELDGGFSDLLAAQKKVSEGGDSSFARKTKTKVNKTRKKDTKSKEEEEE
ncbi:hypothetical protein OAQ40_03320 [Euryarchaeota archaeon]|nr:hypothetical protein [Euryarchaeota archaeon]